ncbi:glycerophosphodiester phosphodiesterase family protein [Xanthomonas arboricola]|uniref:glycerophosphodiester phosphodiesterase family protein n=1 Tax=Xanthomonas arboricola TaxID=56448 RepID=UPI000E1F5589|nr:glycerophosphodiester phosphodiesterase family protein [Xanthomonas arboricola]
MPILSAPHPLARACRLLSALAVLAALPQLAVASCGNTANKMAEILNDKFTADTLVLAHRGLWGKYASDPSLPENSSRAVLTADVQCMDGVELDVKITKDGMPVLMHDYNLGRTTDVYTVVGGPKYNPINGLGSNPLVSSMSLADIKRLHLLTPDRRTVTLWEVYSLDELFAYWRKNNMQLPLIFDVKTADGVRAVHTAALRAFPNHPEQVVAMKVNATLFPHPTTFAGNAKYVHAIPVYTTNMLSSIDVPASRVEWQNYAHTLEINVKQDDGLLQGQKNAARASGKRIGVFQAIPDGPLAGRFYNNNGSCCYALSKNFSSYQGKSDTADHRGDIAFLMSQGFGLITTDDPKGAMRTLKTNGRRVSHYAP